MRMGFKARVGGEQWVAREELRFGSPSYGKLRQSCTNFELPGSRPGSHPTTK
jgi:hypothetical protein